MSTTRPEDKASAAPTSGARMLQVLSAIVDAPGPVSVRELARGLGFAASTVHRLLGVLRAGGYVAHHPGPRTYGVGPQLYRLSAVVLGRVNPVTLAAQVAADAAAEFDETILFGSLLPESRAMSFEARADGTKRLAYVVEMHRPVPLVWGASGKAILAHLPAAEVEAIHAESGLSPAGEQARVPLEELRRELAAIRRDGYAVSEGEKLPDARGVAAPVFGPDGVVGSLCLTSPRTRIDNRSLGRIGRRMVEHAARLSDQLGAPTS